MTCAIPGKENKVPESNLLKVAVPPAIAAELEGAVVGQWALRWWLRD